MITKKYFYLIVGDRKFSLKHYCGINVHDVKHDYLIIKNWFEPFGDNEFKFILNNELDIYFFYDWHELIKKDIITDFNNIKIIDEINNITISLYDCQLIEFSHDELKVKLLYKMCDIN